MSNETPACMVFLYERMHSSPSQVAHLLPVYAGDFGGTFACVASPFEASAVAALVYTTYDGCWSPVQMIQMFTPVDCSVCSYKFDSRQLDAALWTHA